MRRVALLVALAGTGCVDPVEPTGAAAKTILAFRAELAQVDRETDQYVERMTAASAESCAAVRSTYDREVRPLIVIRLAELAPDLDELIVERGGAGYADLACLTEALHVALDDHLAAACTVADFGAEAQRHADAVAALVSAGDARTFELLPWVGFSAPPVPCP